MRTKLTDLSIRKLPHPEKGSVKYWDTVTPAFGVRVSPTFKSFFVVYGKNRKSVTIGKYGDVTLSEARAEAKRLLVHKPLMKTSMTLNEARDMYLADCLSKNRASTVSGYRHHLSSVKKHLLSEVNKVDVPNEAHAIMAWKIFFNWCIRNELAEKNPFVHMSVTYTKRDRVLTTDELVAVWNYEYPPFSNLLKMMILTGQRRGEVGRLVAKQEVLMLAGEHTKNGKPHSIPLTPLVKQFHTPSNYNGWSKAKKRLDKHSGVNDFTLHDLRRTFATIHAQIGTPIHVIEAILNHSSGTISGVAAIYIRHNFLKEAREAQLNYEAHLSDLVGR